MRSALVVVDLQVGVLATCVDAAGTLARTAALVGRARDAGVPVVWVQDEQDFARGSDDWQLAAPLDPAADEPRVLKAYRDAFTAGELVPALAGATHLVVAGAQSDFCVRTLAQSAIARGYDVTLAADCHTTCDAELAGGTIPGTLVVQHVNAYFAHMRHAGRRIAATPSAQIVLD